MSTVGAETLKSVLLQILQRTDTPSEVRDSMHAVAFSLECIRMKKTERGVAKVVERALEEYNEVLETLAEVLVKMVKEMAKQVKDREGRADFKEGQVVESVSNQEGGRKKGAHLTRNTYADVVRKAKQADILYQAHSTAQQLIFDFPAESMTIKNLLEKELTMKAAMAKELIASWGLTPQDCFHLCT